MPSESIFILVVVVVVAVVVVAIFDVVSDDGGIFVDTDDDADEDNNGTCAFPLIFVFLIWLLFSYKSCLSSVKEYLRRVGSTPVR